MVQKTGLTPDQRKIQKRKMQYTGSGKTVVKNKCGSKPEDITTMQTKPKGENLKGEKRKTKQQKRKGQQTGKRLGAH